MKEAMTGSKGSRKLIRDPIHGYVPISHRELVIIDSPYFQRLRYIKQNSTAYLTYPSSSHSRFEHSIGVTHIAGKIARSAIEHLQGSRYRKEFFKQAEEAGFAKQTQEFRAGTQDKEQKISDRIVSVVRMGALLHDIGHFPLSHAVEFSFERVPKALEEIYPDLRAKGGKLKLHEHISIQIAKEYIGELFIKLNDDEGTHLLELTLALTDEEKRKNFPLFETLYTVFHSDIDADRCDSLARDGLVSGIGFGRFDVDRIVDSFRLKMQEEATPPRFDLLPSFSGVSAIESALLERYKIYKWLNYHHKVVFTDLVATKLVSILVNSLTMPKIREPLNRLLPLKKFDYHNFCSDGELFDDVFLINAFRQIYGALRSSDTSIKIDFNDGDSTQTDQNSFVEMLLEIILLRKNYGVSAWKTTDEYHSLQQGDEFRPLREAIETRHGVKCTPPPGMPWLNCIAMIIRNLKDEQKVWFSLDEALLETDRTVKVVFDIKSFETYELHMLPKDYEQNPYPIEEWSPVLSNIRRVWDHDTQFFLYFITRKPDEIVKKRKAELLTEFCKHLGYWYKKSPSLEPYAKNLEDFWRDLRHRN